MIFEDFEIINQPCPKCGHDHINRAGCSSIFCDDGLIDESDEDFCIEGTIMRKCPECLGTSFIMWCPSCGTNLTGLKIEYNEYE